MPLADPTWRVLEGDARRLDLPDGSVHCVLLSPPYWGLRRYLDDDREIGREDTLQEWVDSLVECSREWRRVMRPDAQLWINVGDAYASSSFSERPFGKEEDITGDKAHLDIPCPPVPSGLKPKDLIGLPWRLAFALQADGWYLRSAICWTKGADWLPNERAAQDTIRKALQQVREEAAASLFGLSKELSTVLKKAERAVDRIMTSGPCMPESVTDRCTSSYEMLFMFSKQKRYYFDQTAIQVGFADDRMGNPGAYKWSYAHDPETGRGVRGSGGPSSEMGTKGWNSDGSRGGRNPRSVWLLWRVNTEPTGTYILPSGEECSHFAAWPSRLVKRILKAATSEAGVCRTCGALWKRMERRTSHTLPVEDRHGRESHIGAPPQQSGWYWTPPEVEQAGWEPTCECHGSPIPGPIPCEYCRGTGHQHGTRSANTETSYEISMTANRLALLRQTSRQEGGEYDASFDGIETGDPCPHCLCPDCNGMGREHVKPDGRRPLEVVAVGDSNRYGRVPGSDTRGMPTRDWIGEPIDDPCPTCHGVGSLGYLTGPVWPDEVLENWPRVPATVLDPMAGSGTSGRAALDLGLSVVLNDLSPQYVKLMRARMEAYPDDVPIKGRSKSDLEDVLLPLFEEMGVDL